MGALPVAALVLYVNWIILKTLLSPFMLIFGGAGLILVVSLIAWATWTGSTPEPDQGATRGPGTGVDDRA